VLVEDAHGMAPTIPFWLGEAPARTDELSDEVSDLRDRIDAMLEAGHELESIVEWTSAECHASRETATQLVEYLWASRQALGAMPTKNRLVAERFFDDAGGMQLVIHSPLGGRINKAWGLALRKRFCRSFNFELQAAATDDGLIISLGPPHSFPLETVFDFLTTTTARKVLEQAVIDSPVFGVRWRWNSTRSLAVLRRLGGKKVAPNLLRMRTEDLLTVVFPMAQACLENVVGDIELPDHPLVNETMDDCLGEFMDADAFVELIGRIQAKELEIAAVDTTEPSPLSHEIINANPYAFLDDVPLEERRTRAVSVPRGIRLEDRQRVIDDAAIEAASAEAMPAIRDADELHDLLLSVVAWPPQPEHAPLFGELVAAGRATVWTRGDHRLWVATERLKATESALPGGRAEPTVVDLGDDPVDPERAMEITVRGHLELGAPITAAKLAERLGAGIDGIEIALRTLESQGGIIRGQFSATARVTDSTEWVDRRILARIHRIAIGKLRRAVEPVDGTALMRFLLRWQRLAPSTQAMGSDGLVRVIEQLQGFESAAGAWESEILPTRLCSYEPAWLDTLCLSGRVAWARLSPKRTASEDGARINVPTRAAPLTLCMRPNLGWLRASSSSDLEQHLAELSPGARVVHKLLSERGALFVSELVTESALPAAQVEEALWQLVCIGAAVADGFASLRVLIGNRRKAKASRFDDQRGVQTSHSSRWQRVVSRARSRDARRPKHASASMPTAAGRWSALAPAHPDAIDAERSARQLLDRYGVVFRELLARESNLPPWRDLLAALRALEARGEIRGGRFVTGFAGEQFALPEAVEGLRAARSPNRLSTQIVRVAATDPLNLVGITSPGNRVPAVIGNAVLYRDGMPIATLVGGELEIRGQLDAGESVGADLAYSAPRAKSEQVRLPF
jgi:ATP-dependent Lhr-like helicase